MFNLKFNNDLLFLLLLLAHLKLEPDTDLFYNRWNYDSEIRSVPLGNSAAFTRISVHSSIQAGFSYPHPKASIEPDEETSLFSRLHFLDTLRARRPSLIACVSDSGSPGAKHAEGHDNSATDERDNTLRFDEHELTAEVRYFF